MASPSLFGPDHQQSQGLRLFFYTVSWETLGPPNPGLQASSSPLGRSTPTSLA